MDRLLETAARFGVAVIDAGADGADVVVNAVRREIAVDLAMLGNALRVLRALGQAFSEMARTEHFPDELASIALQLGVTSPEQLEAAIEAEIATLEQIDRELTDLGADASAGK